MKKLKIFIKKIESMPSILAVKSGLIMIIPVLMIGSASLVLKYFPITAYQHFIKTVLNGSISAFLDMIYQATFGMLSVFITSTISYSYAKNKVNNRASLATPITSMICFFILSGIGSDTVFLKALGVQGMAIAIICALLSTKLLIHISTYLKKKKHRYMQDSDVEFNHAVSVIIPILIVVAIFALANTLIMSISKCNSIFDLSVKAINQLFSHMGRGFWSGLLVTVLSGLLWFFGIHGSDILESVMVNLFSPAIDINIGNISMGQAPTEIFSKQFFDVFVLMGGCGTAICLLISILLFSKYPRSKRITKIAALPMIFNINELMIFGYPIIYNIILFVPFIITPVISFMTSYFAMKIGLVGYTIAEVNWTCPVLLSGYLATKSISGTLLQLFNIIIGVCIYTPFIKIYDKHCINSAKESMNELVNAKKYSEASLIPVELTKMLDNKGVLARSLVSDLKYSLEKELLTMYYQPQYDNLGNCIGSEALLRWNHPFYGMIYPPMIIQIAREAGILDTLDEYIFKHTLHDVNRIFNETGFTEKISINICSDTIQNDNFITLLKETSENEHFREGNICLEITEQTALTENEEIFKRLKYIKQLGYLLAIDDFSMGHTSLKYLRQNSFDIIKLDGTLVNDMIKNPTSYDIVKSIMLLSKKLGICVIAEYVQSAEQVEILEKMGCTVYQGYLYSKPIAKEDFISLITDKKIIYCR